MGEAEVSGGGAISAIILAGGRSIRLGRDKAFLEVNDRPLVERIVDTVAQLSDEVIIVANDVDAYEQFEALVVPDVYPGTAALGGVFSGLKAAGNRHALVVACDMPFLSLSLLRYMRSLATAYDVVIPRLGKLTEALHAIYSQDCLPFIEGQLLARDLKISNLFGHVRVRYVDQEEIDLFDPDHLSFFNINTEADLVRAREMLARGPDHFRSANRLASGDRPRPSSAPSQVRR
jgi:molybdopterin-guanine dinucleotide biosynthesis protein A